MILLIVLYYCVGIPNSFYVKWLYREGFPFPFMISFLSSIIVYTFSLVALYFQRIKRYKTANVDPDCDAKYREDIEVGSHRFFVFNMVTSLLGLVGGTLDTFAFNSMSVSMNSVMTSTSPLWMSLSFALYERRRLHWSKWIAIVFLASGVLLTVVETVDVNWIGIAFASIALFLGSISNSMMSQMMDEFAPWFMDFNMVVYSSIYSMAGGMVFAYYYEGREFFAYTATHSYTWMIFHLVAISALQMVLQLVVQRIQAGSSSLTMSIIRSVRTVANICIGLFILHDSSWNSLKLIGISIAFVSCTVYALPTKKAQ